jgi:hypothetical protein
LQQTGERSSEGKTAVSIESTCGVATLDVVEVAELEDVVVEDELVDSIEEEELDVVTLVCMVLSVVVGEVVGTEVIDEVDVLMVVVEVVADGLVAK